MGEADDPAKPLCRAQGLEDCPLILQAALHSPLFSPLTSLVVLVLVHLIQDIFPAVSRSLDLSLLLIPFVLRGPLLDHAVGCLVSPPFHFSLPVP